MTGYWYQLANIIIGLGKSVPLILQASICSLFQYPGHLVTKLKVDCISTRSYGKTAVHWFIYGCEKMWFVHLNPHLHKKERKINVCSELEPLDFVFIDFLSQRPGTESGFQHNVVTTIYT